MKSAGIAVLQLTFRFFIFDFPFGCRFGLPTFLGRRSLGEVGWPFTDVLRKFWRFVTWKAERDRTQTQSDAVPPCVRARRDTEKQIRATTSFSRRRYLVVLRKSSRLRGRGRQHARGVRWPSVTLARPAAVLLPEVSQNVGRRTESPKRTSFSSHHS